MYIFIHMHVPIYIYLHISGFTQEFVFRCVVQVTASELRYLFMFSSSGEWPDDIENGPDFPPDGPDEGGPMGPDRG